MATTIDGMTDAPTPTQDVPESGHHRRHFGRRELFALGAAGLTLITGGLLMRNHSGGENHAVDSGAGISAPALDQDKAIVPVAPQGDTITGEITTVPETAAAMDPSAEPAHVGPLSETPAPNETVDEGAGKERAVTGDEALATMSKHEKEQKINGLSGKYQRIILDEGIKDYARPEGADTVSKLQSKQAAYDAAVFLVNGEHYLGVNMRTGTDGNYSMTEDFFKLDAETVAKISTFDDNTGEYTPVNLDDMILSTQEHTVGSVDEDGRARTNEPGAYQGAPSPQLAQANYWEVRPTQPPTAD